MDVFEAVSGRRSIRRFTEQDVSMEHERMLKKSLIAAPSAGNLHARKFYFIRDAQLQLQLGEAALRQTFIAKAPLLIVGCTDSQAISKYGERGVTLYSVQDVSASVMGMMLVAHELGLGTVWIGAFDEAQVSKLLNLPGNLRPVAMIPVGHPLKLPRPIERPSIDETCVDFPPS